MRDPGLDRHLWETEWQALEPLVVDDPAGALSELDDLVRRMLLAEGYPLEEGELEHTAEEGIDPELLASYESAREIRLRADAGGDVDPAEIGEAIGLYRSIYEHLLSRGAEPG